MNVSVKLDGCGRFVCALLWFLTCFPPRQHPLQPALFWPSAASLAGAEDGARPSHLSAAAPTSFPADCSVLRSLQEVH